MIPATLLYLSVAIVIAVALDSDRRTDDNGARFRPLSTLELYCAAALWLPVFIAACVAVVVDAAAAARRR